MYGKQKTGWKEIEIHIRLIIKLDDEEYLEYAE